MNSFLNLDTIKSCGLITYEDSRRDLTKCFHMTTRISLSVDLFMFYFIFILYSYRILSRNLAGHECTVSCTAIFMTETYLQ